VRKRLAWLSTSLATAAVLAIVSSTAGAASLPRYDHVFMLVEENHGYQDIIGNPAAPTINALAHWNGSKWSVVPSPDPGPNGNELFGVGASTPDDAWAVGQQQGDGFPSHALVERWNGNEWQVAEAPKSSTESFDPYAATTFAGDLLAAGNRETDARPQNTLSFTGDKVIPSANVGAGENDFYAVAADGQTALAAGRTTDPVTDAASTLIETLKNGARAVVPTPNPGGSGGTAGLGGVAIGSGGQAWAVGVYTTSSSSNRTLIERFVP
jgi:hypothetical protein